MNIKDYQGIIDKTAVYPKHLGPAYTVLGLIGELGEFANAVTKVDGQNVKKEAGDVFWYITATCNEFGIPLEDVFRAYPKNWAMDFNADEAATEAIIIATEVAEITKKFCRDGNIDLSIMKLKLTHICTHVLRASSHFRHDLDSILETNYTKLIKRRKTNTLHGSGDNREETPLQINPNETDPFYA
jgi:hypothetical protein